MNAVNTKLRIKKQNVKLRKDKTQINCIKLLTTVKRVRLGLELYFIYSVYLFN